MTELTLNQVEAVATLAIVAACDPDDMPIAISKVLHQFGLINGRLQESPAERSTFERIAAAVQRQLDRMRANLPPVETADGFAPDRILDKLTRDYADGPFGRQPWSYADA